MIGEKASKSSRPPFTMKRSLLSKEGNRAIYAILADGVQVGIASRANGDGDFGFVAAWGEQEHRPGFVTMHNLQKWVREEVPVDFVKTGKVESLSISDKARDGLREALERQRPDVAIDGRGYVADFHDNLSPHVSPEDFEADLRAGDGNELETKFRAAHSSSALGVNCFAPFRRRIADLRLPTAHLANTAFDHLEFERKCPTGLTGHHGIPPNLDVLLSGPAGIVGIESKLTEFLKRPGLWKSIQTYVDQRPGKPWGQGYVREMHRLKNAPKYYNWLDAAQLIKHAFGLAHRFRDRDDPITLLYLFWEPENHKRYPMFAEHRREIAEFAERVAGSKPAFTAMSYPELWRFWRESAPDQWLSEHLDQLEERYRIPI